MQCWQRSSFKPSMSLKDVVLDMISDAKDWLNSAVYLLCPYSIPDCRQIVFSIRIWGTWREYTQIYFPYDLSFFFTPTCLGLKFFVSGCCCCCCILLIFSSALNIKMLCCCCWWWSCCILLIFSPALNLNVLCRWLKIAKALIWMLTSPWRRNFKISKLVIRLHLF